MIPVAGMVALMLTFQTEGSVVAALPGTTRSAGLGGAGAALVGITMTRSNNEASEMATARGAAI